MDEAISRRSLSAIMFVDIVGYTALMQSDEDRAKTIRDRMRHAVETGISNYGGSVVQYYGDGILATFPSALESVRAGVEIQEELSKPPEVTVRVGLHAGDIVRDAEGAYGDGVNVASRVESLSVPGGVLMSAKIHDEIRNHPTIQTEDMGLFDLKNVAEPMRLHAVSSHGMVVPNPSEMESRHDPAVGNLPSEAAIQQWSAKLFMDASDPILIENLVGIVLDANPEAERAYGFTREELIGRPIKTLVPPDRHRQADALLETCRTGGEVRNVEGLRWTKSEEVRSVLLTLSALRDELGEIVAIATLAKDITELKAAEKALATEREELDARVSARTRDLTEARSRLEATTERLRKYVSPEIYRSVVEQDRKTRIDPSRKWLTLFFADVAEFARISGDMEVGELGEALNEYFHEMTHIGSKCGGTLNRFPGAAIFVAFGDPTSSGESGDALACVSAALEMQARMSALREERAARGRGHPFHLRMGIASGYCLVGDFGSDEHMSYSILGQQVDLARLVQSQAGPNEILITKPVWTLVHDRFKCVPAPPIHSETLDEAAEVYRVVETVDAGADTGTMHRSGPGFSLWLDPGLASDEDRAAVARDLRDALGRLESDGEPPPT